MIGCTKPITVVGASSNGTLGVGSKNEILNDPLSFMGNQEGHMKTDKLTNRVEKETKGHFTTNTCRSKC